MRVALALAAARAAFDPRTGVPTVVFRNRQAATDPVRRFAQAATRSP